MHQLVSASLAYWVIVIQLFWISTLALQLKIVAYNKAGLYAIQLKHPFAPTKHKFFLIICLNNPIKNSKKIRKKFDKISKENSKIITMNNTIKKFEKMSKKLSKENSIKKFRYIIE